MEWYPLVSGVDDDDVLFFICCPIFTPDWLSLTHFGVVEPSLLRDKRCSVFAHSGHTNFGDSAEVRHFFLLQRLRLRLRGSEMIVLERVSVISLPFLVAVALPLSNPLINFPKQCHFCWFSLSLLLKHTHTNAKHCTRSSYRVSYPIYQIHTSRAEQSSLALSEKMAKSAAAERDQKVADDASRQTVTRLARVSVYLSSVGLFVRLRRNQNLKSLRLRFSVIGRRKTD